MTSRAQYLGIDLGTTNSAAALFDGDAISLVRTAQGGPLTPSVVRLDARGNVLVGARARRMLESDPDNTRAEFKRLMGTGQTLSFAAAKASRKPEELAAEVLKSIRRDAQDQLGFAPERAVVTVPALFELPQSQATSEAARLAGFERVELLQEPVASALAAGWKAEDDQGSWLVYDLGGGTFDASLLETREGLLRVVGHDGDNFLGGRDLDQAIVDWALGELARDGVVIERSDPKHGAALRRLRLAAEEAKIELARAKEAPLSVPNLFEVDGAAMDVDLLLERATLERLVTPLVDRSIAVCRRLLETHQVDGRGLARIVLVGGPTMMPLLRERVSSALGAPLGEGLDPMTLVAQGAAVYAATAGLDARPAVKSTSKARKLWLQYPAMTSDPNPHVVGRLTPGEGPAPVEVRLAREDGRWSSEHASLDAEGAFVTQVELALRRPNTFRIEARASDGQPVEVDPATLTILHGLTISDPPLSRTIGVALANDRVQVYFERGCPLPARRRFTHRTVESVARGSTGSLLRIPIVQGEFDFAHLCRLVGTLEISGEAVQQSLPAGSDVEVTLELDRGGRLAARALVPATGQVFEEVAQLVAPDVTPESLARTIAELQGRLQSVRTDAFRRGAARTIEKLSNAEADLAQAERDMESAKGGDLDAAQKARRMLLDVDALLEAAEVDKKWPELEAEAQRAYLWAADWTGEYGTEHEQRMLADAQKQVERARQDQNAAELQRQLRVIRSIGTTSFFRAPDAWELEFKYAASRIDDASDLPKAHALVNEGRQAMQKGDKNALRDVVQQLRRLLPADAEDRRRGFDSGIR